MHAPPVLSAAPRSRSTHRGALLALLLAAIPSPALVHADAQIHGQWSELRPDTMTGVLVHVGLVRGDGSPFHSRVVWAGAQAGQVGVLGWKNDGAGCNSFPDTTLATGNLIPIPFSGGPPSQNLFCGGWSVLNGELISVGGSDATLEGLRDVLTYNPAGGISGGTWTARKSMGQHRWYPSATPLREPNRMLTVAGHKYDHMWSYSGRRNGLAPAGYLVDRCGRIPRGNWDPSVATIAAVAADGLPPPREGHTLAYMHARNAPFMFGGRNGTGDPVPNDVWYLTRVDGGDLDADYQYPWTRLTVPADPRPDPRSEHVALAASASDMIVFGGLKKVGGTETALSDLWRLHKVGSSWVWEEVNVTSGDPPTARFGHTAVYDEHVFLSGQPPVRRLLVFGGTTTNLGLSDNEVHIFTFDGATFTSGSWSSLALAGGPRPDARYDHTMTLTPHPWGAGRRLAWVYGGRDNIAPLNDPKVWHLRLGASDPNDISWDGFEPDPDVDAAIGPRSPGPIAGHAAIYDPVISRLSFLGGGASDKHIFQLNNKLPYDSLGNTIKPDWGRGEETSVLLNGHAMAFDPTPLAEEPTFTQAFALIPEIYNRGTASEGGTWTSLPGAGRKPDYYPVQFLVPRIPFSASICRVVEVGDDRPSRYLDIPADIPSSGDGVGPWNTLGDGAIGFDADPDFNATAGVMYRPGKILIAGGTTLAGPTNLAATLDVAGTAGWLAAPTMTLPRYYHNLVLLPTGGVMAIGGMTKSYANPKFYDQADAVPIPEYWEPGAADWFDYASAGTVIRNYHSTAILMPDGRVLTGGGWGDYKVGENPACPTPGSCTPNPDMKKLQLFCPPYLFKDAAGTPAMRPVIQSAPDTIRWRQTFTVCVADTANIRSACLIRPGATTHSVDMNQRFVPLTIEGHAGSGAAGDPRRLFLTAPASPDSAPPGDYMLFILGSSDGPKVPSVARWVRVQATGDDLCDVVPGATLADLHPEIVGSTSIGFTWTATADDGSLPASGPAREFDLRYTAIGPITSEAMWGIATWAAGEPVPDPNGSPHTHTLSNLQPCTNYYFALRSNDDKPNLSGIPSSLSVQTTCNGGGGEFSAREARSDEGGSGSTGAPLNSELPNLSGGTSSTPASIGRGGAALSSAGSLQSATGLLVVGTHRDEEGAWRVTLHLEESPAGTDPATATITVEQSDAGSEPDTLGRFEPSDDDHVLGLCSLRERGRLGIPGVHRIERVVPHLKTRTGDHLLASALHSRLGALGPEFTAAGGGIKFEVGDSLVLIYMPAPEPLTDAASWYVLVRRTSDAPPIPMGSRRGRVGEALPVQFALHQNRPNPFRGTTIIAFDLPAESPVTLEVFDLLGRRVAVLADAGYPAGRHSVEWDLRDLTGTRVRPAVYAYRLTAGTFRERRKINVLE